MPLTLKLHWSALKTQCYGKHLKEFNKYLINRDTNTGGSDGVRDIVLLDSAIESAYATFDGNDLYPSKEEKAAKIGYSLISNHAFVDGNKRIGMYVMLTFLEVNGINLNLSDQDIIDMGMGLAKSEVNYDSLLNWIIEHKI